MPYGTIRPCRVTVSTYGSAPAVEIADAISALPATRQGSYSCPSDAGTGLMLLFHYFGTSQVERVDVDFTGCGGVTAPGRTSRKLTARLRTLLDAEAPPGWS